MKRPDAKGRKAARQAGLPPFNRKRKNPPILVCLAFSVGFICTLSAFECFPGAAGNPQRKVRGLRYSKAGVFAAFLHIGEPFFLLRWFMIPILTLLSATYEHARMNCCFRRVCYFFIGIIFQIFFLFSDALCPEVSFDGISARNIGAFAIPVDLLSGLF